MRGEEVVWEERVGGEVSGKVLSHSCGQGIEVAEHEASAGCLDCSGGGDQRDGEGGRGCHSGGGAGGYEWDA
jgi:hypothetical protein